HRSAIGRHLIVLDALRRADQGRIESRAGLTLLHDGVALLDQALHALTGMTGDGDAEILADLLDPGEVPFRHLEVLLDGLLQFRAAGGLGKFRQSLDQLLLRAVKVFEVVLEYIFEVGERHASSYVAEWPDAAGCFLRPAKGRRTR